MRLRRLRWGRKRQPKLRKCSDACTPFGKHDDACMPFAIYSFRPRKAGDVSLNLLSSGIAKLSQPGAVAEWLRFCVNFRREVPLSLLSSGIANS